MESAAKKSFLCFTALEAPSLNGSTELHNCDKGTNSNKDYNVYCVSFTSNCMYYYLEAHVDFCAKHWSVFISKIYNQLKRKHCARNCERECYKGPGLLIADSTGHF